MVGATSMAQVPAVVVPIRAPGERLLARLPGRIAETLTAEQTEAIQHAAEDMSWGRHPLDIRLSLPFFARCYYVTVIAGAEKRGAARRRRDRQRYPLRTVANVFFFVGIAVAVYVAALLALAARLFLFGSR